MKRCVFLVLIFLTVSTSSMALPFSATIGPIPEAIQHQMKLNDSWKERCPVQLRDLRYLQLRHYGLDNKVHDGVLIVHRGVAEEVVHIFDVLYRLRFPIERMRPMYQYKGDDNKSMSDNNTSAFMCRENTNKPGEMSKHSYGIAIDINPKLNPHIKDGKVLPENAEHYQDRNQRLPGMIHHNDLIVKLFKSKGWTWGGTWRSVQDYQHFEKTSN